MPHTRGFAGIRNRLAGPDRPDAAPEMEVNFLGLVGPSGVLPQHYNELVIQRLRQYKDSALRDFLDLFHHRTISLFYRAWEKYRFPVVYERTARSGRPMTREREHLDFTWYLHCLVGQGTPGLRGRLDVDDEAFLYYSGHFRTPATFGSRPDGSGGRLFRSVGAGHPVSRAVAVPQEDRSEPHGGPGLP